MSASEAFWRAPRRLRRLLEDGDLTPTQYALLHYVGEAGGDRERFATSQGFLAELLRVEKKTIQRGLKSLRELRLIDHDLAAGKSVFHIWLGPEALVAEANPEANLGHPPDTTSDTPRTLEAPPMSEVTSDTPPPEKTRKPAPAKGSRRRPTSDTSRASAETETETETETKSNPPNVGGNKERRAREVGGGGGVAFAATEDPSEGGGTALSEQTLNEVCQSSYGLSTTEAFESFVGGFELSDELRARAWLVFEKAPDWLLTCSHRMRGTPELFSPYVEEALGNGGQPLGSAESEIFEADEPSDEQKALYGERPRAPSVTEPAEEPVAEEPEPAEAESVAEPGYFAAQFAERRKAKAAEAAAAAAKNGNGNGPSHIPTARLLALVKDRIEADSTEAVAARADIHPDTLLRILRGTRKQLRFDTADRLLGAIDHEFLWHLDPPDGLSDLYGSSA